MKYPGLPSTLFIRNRFKLFDHLSKGSIVLLSSNKNMPRNGDQFYPYRQSSDLYYLTGIVQAGTILLLFPEYPLKEFREILFLQESSQKSLKWEGGCLTKEQAHDISGIENIQWISELDTMIYKLISDAREIYYNSVGNSEVLPGSSAPDQQISEMIMKKYPNLEERPLGPIMTRLRMIKELEEVELMKKAIDITGKAFQSVLRELKPGRNEAEIEALILYEFLRNGAEGPAFESIVASGKNALILHYVENNDVCSKDDLLLLDIGADLGYYAADCSRTIPVKGRFTKRQLEIYKAGLRVIKQAMELMTTGKKMQEFHQEVGLLWEKEHVELGLYTMKEIQKQDPATPLWKKYYWHGTSHSIGIDVHDSFDSEFPFHPGMVLSCEPGIYIPEEGVGLRLENDILITEQGPVDLTADIPIEAGEIEDLMN